MQTSSHCAAPVVEVLNIPSPSSIYSRLNSRKYFFSKRVVDQWNRLPTTTVCAETINRFKNQIDPHVDIIRAKANQQLAFVRRNIRTRSSSTKDKLFHTLVRPQLEYAATVCDPHISKQKHSLEMIQRRAARWVTNRHHNTSSVTDMLHTLGWTSLEHRRATSRLCMLFQI